MPWAGFVLAVLESPCLRNFWINKNVNFAHVARALLVWNKNQNCCTFTVFNDLIWKPRYSQVLWVFVLLESSSETIEEHSPFFLILEAINAHASLDVYFVTSTHVSEAKLSWNVSEVTDAYAEALFLYHTTSINTHLLFRTELVWKHRRFASDPFADISGFAWLAGFHDTSNILLSMVTSAVSSKGPYFQRTYCIKLQATFGDDQNLYNCWTMNMWNNFWTLRKVRSK